MGVSSSIGTFELNTFNVKNDYIILLKFFCLNVLKFKRALSYGAAYARAPFYFLLLRLRWYSDNNELLFNSLLSLYQRKRRSDKNQKKLYYEICSFSIYKKRTAIAIAGKIKPTTGTRIDGSTELIIFLFQ